MHELEKEVTETQAAKEILGKIPRKTSGKKENDQADDQGTDDIKEYLTGLHISGHTASPVCKNHTPPLADMPYFVFVLVLTGGAPRASVSKGLILNQGHICVGHFWSPSPEFGHFWSPFSWII